jgi:hypothetical protein
MWPKAFFSSAKYFKSSQNCGLFGTSSCTYVKRTDNSENNLFHYFFDIADCNVIGYWTMHRQIFIFLSFHLLLSRLYEEKALINFLNDKEMKN